MHPLLCFFAPKKREREREREFSVDSSGRVSVGRIFSRIGISRGSEPRSLPSLVISCLCSQNSAMIPLFLCVSCCFPGKMGSSHDQNAPKRRRYPFHDVSLTLYLDTPAAQSISLSKTAYRHFLGPSIAHSVRLITSASPSRLFRSALAI